MKKFLAMALCLVMMVTVMAVPAFAAEEEPVSCVIYVNDTQVTETDMATKILVEGDKIKYVLSVTNDTDAAVNIVITKSGYDAFSITSYEGVDYNEEIGTYTSTEVVAVNETATYTFEGTVSSNDIKDGRLSVDFNVQVGDKIIAHSTAIGYSLTGQTIGGETLSQWVTGSVLELDKGYTIPVIGNLDSNDNDIPDKDEQPLDPVEPTPTIDVLVYWTDMEFNYSKEWNTDTLQYDWNWKNGEDYIKVENRSSVDVTAALSFTGATEEYADAVEFVEDAESSVEATWDGSTLSLGHGNQGTEEEVTAPSGTIMVNVTEGTTMETTDDNDAAALWTTLGQITITVSAVTE